MNTRRTLSTLSAIVSVIFIAWILLRRRHGLAELLAVQPQALMLLCGVQGLHLVAQSGRLHAILIGLVGHRIGLLAWTRIYVIGRFLNFVMTQTGTIYRAMEVKRTSGVSVTAYLAVFVSAAWMATVFNLAMAALLVVVIDVRMEVAGIPALAIVVVGLLLAVAAPSLSQQLIPADVPHERLMWLRTRVATLLDLVTESLRDAGYMIRMLWWTATGFLLAVTLFWLAFQTFSIPVGLAEVVVFYTVLQVASYVSVTPGNLGVQEALFGVMGGLIGVGAAEGVLASALLRASSFVVTTVVAIPLGAWGASRRLRNSTLAEE